MESEKGKDIHVVGSESEVFDRIHLARYTMSDDELEREVIVLFLTQLKATIEMIERAETAADWKLWTHTLKGAAAAVGAWRLQAIAVDLESLGVGQGAESRSERLRVLALAVDEFRARVAVDFPQIAA